MFTGCSSSGDAFQHLGGGSIPRASALGHERGEDDALLFTKGCRAQVSLLDSRIGGRSGTTLSTCLSEARLPLEASDGQVKCSRLALKGRDKDVCWSATTNMGVFRACGDKEPRTFLFWLQSGTVSPATNQIAKAMMTMRALTAGNADPRVQGELVKDPVTLWAPLISCRLGKVQAMSEFPKEQGWLQPLACDRDSSQEGPPTRLSLREK